MKQRMVKKKLSHLVEDTHESVPKTKILYQPHELKEIREDRQLIRKNKSNLELQMMKSESRDVISKVIKERE